jgi:RimJ/RimL family protein N-acetyltransferase
MGSEPPSEGRVDEQDGASAPDGGRSVRVEPATVPWLEALAEGDEVFAQRFGIAVEPGWAGFPEAVPAALAATRVTGPDRWGTHLFFATGDGALIGLGGWKGPPVDGAAELGYAVAPSRQGRGIATAVVHELLGRGRIAGLRLAVAHTLGRPSASTTVLTRTGFARVAELEDPDEGPIWRWELPLA